MRRTRFALACVLTLPFAACSADAAYVKADAETYRILAPYAEAGIAASDKDAAAKLDLMDLVKSWALRIRLNGGFAEEPAK